MSFVTFFPMVGRVDNYAFFILKPLYYLIYDRVVIKHSIIIVGEGLAAFFSQVVANSLVVLCLKMLRTCRRTLTIVDMLPHEVE